MSPPSNRRIALVLGGGGLKGFAHVGVLRALEERGIVPSLYAGTSIGSLVAAARAGGMSVAEMAERAGALRRKDLFRLNSVEMLVARLRTESVYQEEPLRRLCESTIPDGTFEKFDVPVLVNTVDLDRGTQVVWGLPGLRDVAVRDAVYASCSLPGFFPPGKVGTMNCADGGVIDNLPVSIAAQQASAIIAVDVGNTDLTRGIGFAGQGFTAIYMRAASMMMHALQQVPLMNWKGPPMLLIRPRVSQIGWFSFGHTAELIEAGYHAAAAALDACPAFTEAPGGVFPRRPVGINVVRERCTSCGLCVSLAPQTMALDRDGKAYALNPVVDWSPADGDFVHHCPTNAIVVAALTPRSVAAIREAEAGVPEGLAR